jgi:hypothetical protein
MEERIARLRAMASDTRAPQPAAQAASVRRGGSVPQTDRGPWG